MEPLSNFLRRTRDSNSEALAGGSFQDCCSTIVPVLLFNDELRIEN